MKTFDLTSMGVQEMSALEMQETDGGVILLICAAALLLLSACTVNTTIQVGSDNKNGTQAETKVDSTLNGNDLNLSLDK